MGGGARQRDSQKIRPKSLSRDRCDVSDNSSSTSTAALLETPLETLTEATLADISSNTSFETSSDHSETQVNSPFDTKNDTLGNSASPVSSKKNTSNSSEIFQSFHTPGSSQSHDATLDDVSKSENQIEASEAVQVVPNRNQPAPNCGVDIKDTFNHGLDIKDAHNFALGVNPESESQDHRGFTPTSSSNATNDDRSSSSGVSTNSSSSLRSEDFNSNHSSFSKSQPSNKSHFSNFSSSDNNDSSEIIGTSSESSPRSNSSPRSRSSGFFSSSSSRSSSDASTSSASSVFRQLDLAGKGKLSAKVATFPDIQCPVSSVQYEIL